MLIKQEIIRNWLIEKVEQLRCKNVMYQHYQTSIPYYFRDIDFANYNPQELEQFGELDAIATNGPKRIGINPRDPSIQITIPAIEYMSCKLWVEPEKHEDFISYWKKYDARLGS